MQPIVIKLYKNCWLINDAQMKYDDIYISKFESIIFNDTIDSE